MNLSKGAKIVLKDCLGAKAGEKASVVADYGELLVEDRKILIFSSTF